MDHGEERRGKKVEGCEVMDHGEERRGKKVEGCEGRWRNVDEGGQR